MKNTEQYSLSFSTNFSLLKGLFFYAAPGTIHHLYFKFRVVYTGLHHLYSLDNEWLVLVMDESRIRNRKSRG